ncbi:MAG: hypothetical protein C5B46_01715 [Proteobacteria bacterium]|nr:MAG: hypothetical protein C5B46_01715 [Pseudomonadota bacterium]
MIGHEMKNVRFGLLIFVLLSGAVLVFIAFLLWRGSGSKRGERSVRADELAVYRSLLSDWIQSANGPIYLVSIPMPLDDADCQSSIIHGNMTDIGQFVSSDISQLKTDKIRFLDIGTSIDPPRREEVTRNIRRGAPMSGGVLGQVVGGPVLTFSSVLFDSSHRQAIAGYSYWCDWDCGHGKTVLLEKHGSEWSVSKVCTQFVM